MLYFIIEKSRGGKRVTEEFFLKNKERIFAFGEYFLKKLEDRELMDKLFEKDAEKPARVLKLLFDKLDSARPQKENPALTAIIRAVTSGGEERDDEDE